MRIWLAASVAYTAWVLLAGCQSPEESKARDNVIIAQRSKNAHEYCDRMGMRVTGIVCRAWTKDCDIAADHGNPVRAPL
jgi:hypothetical protein